jgi:hypothetical protein
MVVLCNAMNRTPGTGVPWRLNQASPMIMMMMMMFIVRRRIDDVGDRENANRSETKSRR